MKKGLDNISWDMFKLYCVPIWYDNIEMFKKCLESIAKNIYKNTKDPF